MNETTIPNISLYIPHVFPNFTEEYIAGVFESLRIGMVDHIDLVAKMDKQGKPYNAAYIHFKYWCSGTAAENIYYRVKNHTKEARIIHDDPWFWILLENTAKKYEPAARRPRIDIADLKPQSEIYEDEKEYDDEIEAAIEYEKQQAEIEATIQFFEDEAAELELQNELFLEEENKCLHKRIAELKAQNAVLKAENEDMARSLYDAKMQKLAEEAWKNSM
jgi:hypothetical protein